MCGKRRITVNPKIVSILLKSVNCEEIQNIYLFIAYCRRGKGVNEIIIDRGNQCELQHLQFQVLRMQRQTNLLPVQMDPSTTWRSREFLPRTHLTWSSYNRICGNSILNIQYRGI